MDKKYRVNNDLAMNLGSMITHVEVLAHEFRDGRITEAVKCCGKVLTCEDDCWGLYNDLSTLPGFGMYATSAEYGKLVQIQRERTHSRNVANMRRGA